MSSFAYPNPPLHDEVVMLRPWRAADVANMARAISDPAIQRWSHLSANDVDALSRRLADTPAELVAGTAIRMLIVDGRDEQELLGAISIFGIDQDAQTGEVGFWVVAGARGRGVAGRALGLITEWGAAELGLQVIEAICDLDNETSQRVLIRAGFKAHGPVPESSPPAFRYVLTFGQRPLPRPPRARSC